MTISEEQIANAEGAIIRERAEKEEQEPVKEEKINIDVENAVLENMGNFKELAKDTLNFLQQKLENLNKDYERYNDTKYSDEYKSKMLARKTIEEKKLQHEAIETIDKLEKSYIQRVYVSNKATVDSLEYQTRLNNFMKLCELSGGNIDKEAYNFIIEAKDNVTLKLLAKAFNNNIMLQEFYKIDPDTHKQIISRKTNIVKDYMRNMTGMYSTVNADSILQILK